MHLAIFSRYASVLLDDNGCIMVYSCCPALEKRKDEDYAEFLCNSAVGLCRWTWNRFCKVAEGCLLVLAEVH